MSFFPPKILPHKSKKITKKIGTEQELKVSKQFSSRKRQNSLVLRQGRLKYLNSGRCVFTKAASRAAAVDKEPLPLN